MDFIIAVAAVMTLMALLYPLLSANAAYPYALFMDERITFEPIKEAINGSLSDKLAFIFDGHDNRYGRLLWNLNFLFSWFPASLSGDSAQIICTRILQSLLLISGFMLLLSSLVKPLLLRLCAFVILVLLPPSFYYFAMPKPEPEIVLLLGLIFHFYEKKAWKPLMIAIGVLAGLKLSMLPFCLAMVFLVFRQERHIRGNQTVKIKGDLILLFHWKILLTAVLLLFPLAFLLDLHLRSAYSDSLFPQLYKAQWMGYNLYKLFTAVNVFTAAVFLSISLFNLSKHFETASGLLKTGLRLFSGFAICNPYVFFTPFNAGLYLSTPVTHGGDSEDIGFSDWMRHIYDTLLFSNPLLTGLIIFITLSLIVAGFRKEGISLKTLSGSSGLPLLLVFLLTALPVVLMTKRIWGFYLLLPSVLFVLIVFRYAALFFAKKIQIMQSGVIILFVFYTYQALPVFSQAYNDKMTEQKSGIFQKRIAEYNHLCLKINEMTVGKDSIRIFWDPNLFFPDQIENAEVKIFWGPFSRWHEERDLVLLSGHPLELYKSSEGIRNQRQLELARLTFNEAMHEHKGNYREIFKDTFSICRIYILKNSSINQ